MLYPKQPAALDDRGEEAASLYGRINMSVADQHGALAHSAPERQPFHPFRNFLLDLRADLVPSFDLDDIRRPWCLDEKVYLASLAFSIAAFIDEVRLRHSDSRSSRYSFRPMNIKAPFYVSEVNAHIFADSPPQVKREICKCQISSYINRRISSAKLAIFKFRAYRSSATWRVPSTSVIALKDNSFSFPCALCGT